MNAPPPFAHSGKEQTGGQQSIVSQGPGSTTGGRRSNSTHTSEDDGVRSVANDFNTQNTQQNNIQQIHPKYLKR